MQNLEWDEGIQSRFPAVLWLTWFGWFLCNMRYLYWSWNLHMCGCLMSDFLAVRVVAMCLVFGSSCADTCLTGFSKHMAHLATPNRDSLINPHGLLLCWLERDLSFSFYAPPNMISEGENMPRICLWSGLRDPANHDMAKLHFKELCHQAVWNRSVIVNINCHINI